MTTLAKRSRRRQALIRGLLAALGIGAVLGGGVLVMRGLAVPLEANRAQGQLERSFEERLARNRAIERAREQAREGAEEAKREEALHIVPLLSPVRPAASPVKPAARESLSARQPAPEPEMLRLSVARLGVREIVTAGEGSHAQLAKGPVMVKEATGASPVTILAAHRDTHFLFIRDLAKGDEVDLETTTGRHARYRVVRFETVRWNRFAYPLDPAHPMLALVTCYPFGGTEYGGPWRRVAWAERI